jgi:hypothetical protein
MRSSGFIKEIPVTIPRSYEVCGGDYGHGENHD